MLKIYLFLDHKEIQNVIERGKLLLLLVIFTCTTAVAQELSHQVLVPLAGVAVGGGFNYSQTSGETAVQIIGTEKFVLTEGFQQPRMTFVLGTPPPGTGVEVFPNPVIGDLYLKLWGEKPRTFRVIITNINGTVVYSAELKYFENYYNKETISVSNLLSGFYIVKIMSTDGAISRSFKIEKM
jgi:hypothetical protein